MFGKKLLTSYNKLICIFLALPLAVSANANDVSNSPIAAKSLVPVNYYQWFMIGVAITYGMYLVIRAKRKAAKRKV